VQNLHSGEHLLPVDDSRDGYAMGWWRSRHRGHVQLAHGGNMIGFPSYMAMLPEKKLGVAILANGPKRIRDDFTFHKALTQRVFDLLLDAGLPDCTARFLEWASRQQAEELRLLDAPPPLSLEHYTGSYRDVDKQSPVLGIRLGDGGSLLISFAGEGAFSGVLEHWHRDVFRLRAAPGVADMLDAFGPQFVTFTLGPSGSPVAVKAFGAFGGTFTPVQGDASAQ
jgi:hypothetical protein